MVCKIIINRYLINRPPNFETSFDTFKFFQCFTGNLNRHTGMLCGCDSCQRIHPVKRTVQFPVNTGDHLAIQQHFKVFSITAGFSDRPVIIAMIVIVRLMDRCRLRPATHLEHRQYIFIFRVFNDQAITGNSTNEMVKLFFNCIQVLEDISVIKFQVI